MKIKIANLSNGTHQFHFEGDVQKIGLQAPFDGAFAVDVELVKSAHQLIAGIKGQSNAKLECNRCGVTFDKEIGFDFTLVYMYEYQRQQLHDDNDDADDIIMLQPDTDTINLATDVYDFANLAIPMKTLCKEDCKGLCTVCGTDLNVNSCKCEHTQEAGNSPFSQLKNLFNNN